MSSFLGSFLIRCPIMVKCRVEVSRAAESRHILCARSFTGLISRPNYTAPRHVRLHFGGGDKDPQ